VPSGEYIKNKLGALLFIYVLTLSALLLHQNK